MFFLEGQVQSTPLKMPSNGLAKCKCWSKYNSSQLECKAATVTAENTWEEIVKQLSFVSHQFKVFT